MKLIVGLGNPGKEYEKTRHNVGFLAVDGIARDLQFSKWKMEKKLEAEVCRGFIASCCEDVILAKPQTFMNNSGAAVKKLTVNYRLTTDDLLIVHDDLDLELGTLRLSYGSGSAGHNGVQSIIDALGTKDFWRLRVGIGRPPQAPSLKIREGREGYDDTTKFVLQRFPRLSQGKVRKAIAAAVAAVQLMFQKGPHAAQTEINKNK
ncbi:aminoacyl-tRNA hydrolase [Candidatus Uhrbacteria bacterium]|nr:aminoacyl-tRNA hydrolase [Candidatus Uhrbacteria bacterium]